jgi:hypothetical protein
VPSSLNKFKMMSMMKTKSRIKDSQKLSRISSINKMSKLIIRDKCKKYLIKLKILKINRKKQTPRLRF